MLNKPNPKLIMKKHFFLAGLFFLLLFNLSDAQVRFGVKAGGNYTNVTKMHRESDPRFGGQIGALALIPIDNNDMFYVQPEVVYSMQGEYWRTDRKYDVFLNYVNIPVMFKCYFSNVESEFFLEGGPQFGIKVGENIERLESTNLKFNSFDFSLGLGLGYSFTRDFEINVRYNYGFTDVAKNDAADDSNHSSQLSFAVAYLFR